MNHGPNYKNLVVKAEDIIVCFNLLELEKLQQRLEEALHDEVAASRNHF